MKIKFFLLLTVLATLVGLASVNTVSADDGNTPPQADEQQMTPLDPTNFPVAPGRGHGRGKLVVPKEVQELMVVDIEEGVTETLGFDPAGFQGDALAAMVQAAGLDQPASLDQSDDLVLSSSTATATTYCRTRDAWRQGNAAVGVVWRFHHSIYYCYNGSQIVGTPVSWSWASNLKPGWQYNGEISSSQYWRPYPKQYYAFRQGKFRLCFSWCFQEVNPWVSWLVLWEGSATYKTGS